MIRLSEGDPNGFFEVPFAIYPRHSPYVSPLRSDLLRLIDPRRNPFYRGRGEGTHFVAYRGKTPVGRISAHIHHDSNRIYDSTRGFFGFFDLADDAEVAQSLLGAAERWLGDRGCTEIAGNFNLTAVQEIGVVTHGHAEPPYTAMNWSPPHVARLLERHGYEPFFPMTTFEMKLDGFDPESLVGSKTQELLESNEVKVVPLSRSVFQKRAEDVRSLLNQGFESNAHFVPTSTDEFMFQAGPLMWIVDPRLSVLVDWEGTPAGVLVCVPDLNPFLKHTRSRFGVTAPYHFFKQRRNPRRATLVFAAVPPRFQDTGVGGVMIRRTVLELRRRGYESLGITWVSQENGPSLRFMEKLGARPLHELALFGKQLI